MQTKLVNLAARKQKPLSKEYAHDEHSDHYVCKITWKSILRCKNQTNNLITTLNKLSQIT